MIQIDFTKPPEEQEKEFLLSQIEDLKKSQDKVRRKLFAQMTEIMKEYHAIRDEFEMWKKNVCQDNWSKNTYF